jgi:hypothetical protein
MNKWLAMGVTPEHIQEQIRAASGEAEDASKPGPKSELYARQIATLTAIEALNISPICAGEITELLGYRNTWIREFIRGVNKSAPIFIFTHKKRVAKNLGQIKYYTLASNWRELLAEAQEARKIPAKPPLTKIAAEKNVFWDYPARGPA